MRSVVTLASRSELPLTLTRTRAHAHTRTHAHTHAYGYAARRYSAVTTAQHSHPSPEGLRQMQDAGPRHDSAYPDPHLRLNKLTNLAAHHPPVETCLIAIWYNLVSRRTLRFTAAPLRSIQSILTPRRRRGLESLTEPGRSAPPQAPQALQGFPLDPGGTGLRRFPLDRAWNQCPVKINCADT